MAGEETKQTANVDMSTVILDALAKYAAGGGGAGGTGQVYIGTKKIKVPSTIALPGMTEQTVPNVVTTQQLVAMYLNDPKMQSDWRKTMQRNGLETGNPIAERKVFEAAVAGASDWYTTSNRQQKVTPEDYLRWYAGGTKKAAQVPTRQIYNVRPEQIDADVNDIAIQRLGRQLTDTDRQADWYKDLLNSVQKMYRAGVVSEPGKLVKNKKTGKMERLVQQTPEFSKEGVTAAITEAVEAADPAALERKQNLDFANWAFQKMGGRG